MILDEGLGLSAVIGTVLVIVAVFATVRSEASPSPVSEELVADSGGSAGRPGAA